MPTCKDCERCESCKQVVYPDIHYDRESDLKLFCLGESPGSNDDLQGKPFLGSVGIVLHSVLDQVTDSYILDNPVRCFAKHKPKPDELIVCKPHWIETVVKHKPKVIVALGVYAVEAIFGRKVKISSCVGQVTTINIGGRQYPVVLSYHPSYVMGSGKEKGGARALETWIDTWELVGSLIHDDTGTSALPKITRLYKTREVLHFLRWLNEEYKGVIAYDYETWGDAATKGALRPELCNDFKILSVGVGVDQSQSIYGTSGVSFPFDTMKHDVPLDVQCLWQTIIGKSNQPKKHTLVAQNAKYEHKVNLKRFGFTGYLHDTMLAMNVVNELANANLGAIGGYCRISWSGYKFSMSDAQKNPEKMSTERLLEYSGYEGALTYAIWKILSAKVDSLKRTSILQMNQSFAYHLAHIEMDGMHANQQEVINVRLEIDRLIGEAERELLSFSDVKKTEQWAIDNIKSFKEKDHFNCNSPKQVHYLILKVLKVPVKKSKYAKPDASISLDKDVLEKFKDNYPVVNSLLKIRSYTAMKSGFLDKYEEYIGPTGCIHTNYTQVVAVTSRLSSIAPNLQNIPSDSVVRKVFDSRFENGWIVAGDYVQGEPCILAAWSGDPEMCRALNEGYDLHRFVGSKIYSTDYDAVTDVQRWVAKRRNLGSMYGQTAQGLADAANISLDEAKQVVDIYDKMFPKVKEFRLERGKEATRIGMVKDLFGAVRHLRDAQSGDMPKRSRAWRQAGNFPIQSTLNRFHLIAMCLERVFLLENNIKAVVIGVEHDKILVDSANDALGLTIRSLLETMLIHNSASYWRDKPVPMKVDIKYGKSLFEMHKWKL